MPLEFEFTGRVVVSGPAPSLSDLTDHLKRLVQISLDTEHDEALFGIDVALDFDSLQPVLQPSFVQLDNNDDERILTNREDRIFQAAIDGLVEYYPPLGKPGVPSLCRNRIMVPNTGNDQADYETTRDAIEEIATSQGLGSLASYPKVSIPDEFMGGV